MRWVGGTLVPGGSIALFHIPSNQALPLGGSGGAAGARRAAAECGDAPTQAAGSRAPDRQPDPDTLSARDVLALPSMPTTLTLSRRTALRGFGDASPCADVLAGPGGHSTVPLDATATDAGHGMVLVDAPLGRSAVITEDTDAGGCSYQVASAPTVNIEGGGFPTLHEFSARAVRAPVLGSSLEPHRRTAIKASQPVLIASEQVDLSEGEPPYPWVLLIGPGTKETLYAEGDSDEVPPGFSIMPTGSGLFDEPTGKVAVSGATDAGEVFANFTCTPSNLTFLP